MNGQNGNAMQPKTLPGQVAGSFNNAVAGAQAATRYAPATVNAQSLSGTNLKPYMNPYTSNVIDASMGDMNQARQIGLNDIGAQATAAGAFGGSRHGIAEGALQSDFARDAGAMSAGLRAQNFGQAQNAAQFDIANRFAAGQGNRDAALRGADFRLGAASQLGNLSNLGFGMQRQITSDQASSGAQQQALMQSLIDAGRNQYAGFTGAPQQSLATLLAAMSGQPSQSTTTQSQRPGLLNLLSAGLGLL